MRRALTLCSLVAIVACAQAPHAGVRSSGMGIDAFGHTQMSEERATVTLDQAAHVDRLIAELRATLPKYRDVQMAMLDGYRPEGPDVPMGQLKHFINYANLRANWQHLDPDKPMALLYRKRPAGYELAGAMFTAPIASSMDDLDKRIPLAYGHWHSHRNVCEPKANLLPLSREQAREFGFSGSINTEQTCIAAGGVFLENVFGWMVHVYPFEKELAHQF